MSVTSITRAYNIMKLYQGAFYHPKRCCCACLYNGSPCRVRTYDSAVKARGVPNYTNGLQDETHSNYRSYDLYQERTSSHQSGLRCLFGVVWKRDFRPRLLFYWLMCQPVLAGEFPSQRNRLYIRL